MYMEKFSRFFPDQETIDDWCATWGEELAGITGEQIKHGLTLLGRDHSWPPTIAEFRACCESLPKHYAPALPEPKHGVTPHAEACMKLIREMLSKPKPTGNYWAQQVMDKIQRGDRVSVAAEELARKALRTPVA